MKLDTLVFFGFFTRVSGGRYMCRGAGTIKKKLQLIVVSFCVIRDNGYPREFLQKMIR